MNNLPLATYHLSGDGAWHLLAVAAVLLVAAGFGWWQYRREFAGAHEGALRRRWLPALRIGIVALLAWLLWQPVLSRVRHLPTQPRLLVIVDEAPSMATIEDFGGLHRKLDLLTVLEGKGPEGRVATASALAGRAGRLRETLVGGSTAWTKVLRDLDQGLPLPATLSADLASWRQTLGNLTAGLPEVTMPGIAAAENDPLHQGIVRLAALRSASIVAGERLVTDAELAGREAGQHPQLLRDFVQNVQTAAAAAAALQAAANDVQGLLDERLIPPGVRQACQERVLRRSDWARLAVEQFQERFGHRVRLTIRPAKGLNEALEEAFREHLESPLWAVVLVSDGSSEPGSRLPPEVPVLGVLVGRDGVEPADLAVVAVEVPMLAVAGETAEARVLVKNGLPGETRAILEASAGETILGSVELVPSDRLEVVTVPLSVSNPGHQAIEFHARPASGDSFPGNERQPASLEVLPQRARVVLVGGGLREDVAALRQVLAGQPAVEVTTLLSAPGIVELKVGDEQDQFPVAARGWEGVDLVVLAGTLPKVFEEEIGKSALAGLNEAISQGLHVYLREAGDGNGWARALGIVPQPVKTAASLTPTATDWHSFYRLGLDRQASLASLTRLGPLAGANSWPADCQPLLQSNGNPVVAELRRGKGVVILDGLGDLGALRAPGTSAAVNRLLAGLVARAVRPLPEDGSIVIDQPPATVAFELAARSGPLASLAGKSGGQWVNLEDLNSLDLALDEARPPALRLASAWRLWHGWWPLPLLLALVTAEYLLRRRAGRVM